MCGRKRLADRAIARSSGKEVATRKTQKPKRTSRGSAGLSFNLPSGTKVEESLGFSLFCCYKKG